MAGYILKYSAGTYQRKISALEGYYSQLVTHLEQLNTLQGQMKDFWDGSASSTEYMNLISLRLGTGAFRLQRIRLVVGNGGGIAFSGKGPGEQDHQQNENGSPGGT